MAVTGDRTDPFMAFRFSVTFDGIPPCGFSECSGLQMEAPVHEYAEGGLNSHTLRFPSRAKQSNITLRRGIVDTLLWDWLYELTQGQVVRKGATIAVHDPSGAEPKMVWQLIDAFPSKWTGPELSVSQSNVAVEALEIHHEGMFRQT